MLSKSKLKFIEMYSVIYLNIIAIFKCLAIYARWFNLNFLSDSSQKAYLFKVSNVSLPQHIHKMDRII